jgi:hypothetical protein
MKKQFNIAIDEKYAKKVIKEGLNFSKFIEEKTKELFDNKKDLTPYLKNNWTKEEVDYLKEKFRFKSNKEIGNYLGRTESAVKTKRMDLGLRKNVSEYFIGRGKTNPNWKGGLKEVQCSYCHKKIMKDPWRARIYVNLFCNRKCQGNYMSENLVGEKAPSWKGGKFKTSDGYITILMPEHPRADGDGYVKEHRLVVEDYIGRYLTDKEIIHHINEIRTDNRIENLMIFPTNSAHIKFHRKISQFGITNPIQRQIDNRWEKYLNESVEKI